MRIQHIEVAFVDGNVGRLADGAAGVMQPGTHVCQLDEILEILERPVASTAVRVTHERGAIGGGEDGASPADRNRALRISRMLNEFCRRRALDDLTRQSGGHTYS